MYILKITFLTLSIIINNPGICSGAYDNGTATGKGKFGLDLTWNPLNYFPEGQSYFVLSYGFSDKFDFHSYYSHPANGVDNYYFGFFYQLHKNMYLDLATAIGMRQYWPISQKHLFFPQLLYTLYVYKNLRLGGSVIALRDFNNLNKLLGRSFDIGIIIPLINGESCASFLFSSISALVIPNVSSISDHVCSTSTTVE